eukprot:110230-Rhodomonas_salina.1
MASEEVRSDASFNRVTVCVSRIRRCTGRWYGSLGERFLTPPDAHAVDRVLSSRRVHRTQSKRGVGWRVFGTYAAYGATRLEIERAGYCYYMVQYDETAWLSSWRVLKPLPLWQTAPKGKNETARFRIAWNADMCWRGVR